MAARQSGSALTISSTAVKSLSRIGNWPSVRGSSLRALTTSRRVSDTTTSAPVDVVMLKFVDVPR